MVPTDSAAASDAPILLVGGSGQVGWELRQSLPLLGPVVVASRTPPAALRQPEWQPIDMLNPESIRKAVRAVRPRLIVNAAAYTAVDRAEKQTEMAHAINGEAPGILAEEAAELGAALVHYSTDYVFDGSKETPWTEDDEPRPLNVYGESKLAGERAVTASKAPHLILRVSWVYGLNGGNFVKTMLHLAQTRTEIAVVDDQVGAPTSAHTIAAATTFILAQAGRDVAGYLRERGGVYHLSCTGETSWCGFARQIFEHRRQLCPALPVPKVQAITTAEYPTPAARPMNCRLDTRRLRERFGLHLPRWEEALAPCLNVLLTERAETAVASSSKAA